MNFSFKSEFPSVTRTQTVTVTGSFANCTYTATARQVGDCKEYFVVCVLTGNPGAVDFTLTLPTGDVMDATKLPSVAASAGGVLGPILGNGELMDTGAQSWGTCAVAYASTTTVTLYTCSEAETGKTKIVSNTVPFSFASTDRISFKFTAPIVGL